MQQYLSSRNLNVLGLLFNFFGSLLILKYGIPNDVRKNGESYLLLEQEDKNEKVKFRKYKYIQSIGLILLVMGFFIQLIGYAFFD
jgi:hypothetical protein